MFCKNNVEIVQGEGRVLYLGVQENNGSPLDLSEATNIEIWFRKTDGTYLYLSYTNGDIVIMGDAHRGEITATISAIDTGSLMVCTNADFQASVSIGDSEPRRVIFENLLTVIAQKGVTPYRP